MAISQFQMNELGSFVSNAGGTTQAIDPKSKHTYTDSTSIWLEHELFRDVGMRVGYTYKSDGNNTANVQLARLYELYTRQVQVADPGPDGIANNGDDGPAFIVYDIPGPVPASRTETRTVDGIIVVDRAFDITFTRRMRNNWSVMTNFLYNWDRDRGFAQNPNAERFNDNTVEVWAFKVVGRTRRHGAWSCRRRSGIRAATRSRASSRRPAVSIWGRGRRTGRST